MRADLFKGNSLKMITGNITTGINGMDQQYNHKRKEF